MRRIFDTKQIIKMYTCMLYAYEKEFLTNNFETISESDFFKLVLNSRFDFKNSRAIHIAFYFFRVRHYAYISKSGLG